jgi:small subunit ribosomal protein S3
LGQKTHPIGFRLGVIKSWNSKWFADRSFSDLIYEDMMIKRYINARLENAGLARVEILRAPKKVTVDIHTSRPGIVIGRKGAEVDKLREELQLLTKKDISLNIIEVKKPELNARLVADSIAHQLEGRIAYRRAMKRSIMATMKMGAEGIKIVCAGRLAGAEIARSEKYMQGRVPLHTLRADIDYATSTAHTTYGTIGVKVWICRGMVLGSGEMAGKEEPDKGAATRPEFDVPGKKEKRRREEARRSRRPRGRVRKPARRPDQTSQKSDQPADRSDRPPRDRRDGRDTGQGKSSQRPRRDRRRGGRRPTDRRPARDTGANSQGAKPEIKQKKSDAAAGKDKAKPKDKPKKEE